MVTKLGYECLVAADGKRGGLGVAHVRANRRVALGLDDAGCRRARALPPGAQSDWRVSYVYVVLITGLGQPERVLEGMNAGADDYLVGSVDPLHDARLASSQPERASGRCPMQRQVAEFRIPQLEEANLELRSESLTDALTGLGNRRRMEEDLAWARTPVPLRLDRSYGVALFDIDHFKLYNDNYGHLAGDDALREVAHCLDGAVRAGEIGVPLRRRGVLVALARVQHR